VIVINLQDKIVQEMGGRNMRCFMIDDYDVAIKRSHLGVLCGYVEIPKSHQLHQKRKKLERKIDCHGGLTFFGDGSQVGLPFDFTVGFDCGHGFDYIPQFADLYIRDAVEAQYRDEEYVINELQSIVKQLEMME
jgi:hypothetical protein